MKVEIFCSNCRCSYPEEGAPHRCPKCKGHFDIPVFPPFDPAQVESGQPGIWRYRAMFALPEAAPVVSLGEGSTALEWREAFGRQVAFKLEYKNPTGSYKDRGSAVLVSFLRGRGVMAAVEDSSGNAGASFAAYARQSGMRAKIFVPDYASGPKLNQIVEYGAEMVRIQGTRSLAAEAALQAVELGAVYASHAYLPFGLAGYATAAYELYEQMGGVPGTLIAPVGQGNLLLALGRGFQSLRAAGLIAHTPCLVGVQALACAPLWAVARYGAQGMGWVTEGETIAEGVRVRFPVRGDALLRCVAASGGEFLAVDEVDILPGRDQLAQRGLYVEPTSAITWSALAQVVDRLPEPFVVVLTGAKFKSNL